MRQPLLKLRNHLLLDPHFDCLPQLAQAAFKKVIGAFDDYKFFRLGNRRNQFLQLRARTELIACPTDKKFRLRTIAQKVEAIDARFFQSSSHWSHRYSQANERMNPRVRTRRAQSDHRSERESCKDQWQVKLGVEPVQRSLHVFDFSSAVIVFSLAQAGPAKVKAQHGKPEAVQRLHRVEDDLVVQSSAKQGMRMANHGGMSGVGCACVEQRFQPPGGAWEEQRADGGARGRHISDYSRKQVS
jgi:hypothetical protein